ncbi:MAG: hypothetical protein RLN62_05005 [Rickettsiales bacterium]
MLRVVAVFLFLASCANGGNSAATSDQEVCTSYGFAKGSFEYNNCIHKLKEQRANGTQEN